MNYFPVAFFKDVEKIHLGREKLFDMEQRLKAMEELASRTTDVDEAKTLKQQCAELQKTLHHLRFLVDNLEFQQLEVSTSEILQHASILSLSVSNCIC